jgi:hypothetical protein
MRSLGDEIVWAQGPDGLGTDLYRYVPGARAPEVVFRNPIRPTQVDRGIRMRSIEDIAGSSAGYVISEWDIVHQGCCAGPYEEFGWRVWYIAAPGAEPVLLDAAEGLWLQLPEVTMDERFIVWTAEEQDAKSDFPGEEIRMVEIGALDQAVTLMTRPEDDPIYDLELSDGELWYSGCEPCRLEMIDLADLGAPVQAIPAVTDVGFAVTDDVVVWPDAGDRRDCLTIHVRATQSSTSTGVCGVISPSLGDRFVTWTPSGDRDRFVAYDLETGTLQRIGDHTFDGRAEEVSDPSLNGELLAFRYWPEGMEIDAPAQLRWTWLPGPGES